MKGGFYLFVSPTRVVPVLVWGGLSRAELEQTIRRLFAKLGVRVRYKGAYPKWLDKPPA